MLPRNVYSIRCSGRSRWGGMRLGNMELFNGLRGNGIASCFEEKFFEDSDRIQHNETTVALPKSVNIIQEDARLYKCDLQYETVSSVRKNKFKFCFRFK